MCVNINVEPTECHDDLPRSNCFAYPPSLPLPPLSPSFSHPSQVTTVGVSPVRPSTGSGRVISTLVCIVGIMVTVYGVSILGPPWSVGGEWVDIFFFFFVVGWRG